MMKKWSHVLMLGLVCTLPVSALASIKVSNVASQFTYTPVKPKEQNLTQTIDFGFANTTGNTETLNFNGKYTAGYTTTGLNEKPMSLYFDTRAYLTKDQRVTTNEEYSIKVDLEHHLSDTWISYLYTRWLRNRFKNFQNKYQLGLGAGKTLFKNKKIALIAKLGMASNIEQYSNGQSRQNFHSLTQYLQYENTLNTHSRFFMKTGASENIDAFSKDYEVMAVVGLNFSLTEALYMVVEEEVSYDALPPVGFKKRDSKSIIRVGYTF